MIAINELADDLANHGSKRQHERALKMRREFASLEQDLLARGYAIRNEADLRGQQQTAALAPAVDARDETKRNNEVNRTITLQNATTANTGRTLNTAGDVQANLIGAQGDSAVRQINAGYAGAGGLRRTETEGQLAVMDRGRQAMQDQFGHERAMVTPFIGSTPLAEQSFGTALTMQQNQHALIRELAEKAKPTVMQGVLQLAPLALALAG
jgi:hypothetical protein